MPPLTCQIPPSPPFEKGGRGGFIRLGIVDVPGHEGLIKNMLAGAGGIDIVMLVIAADEGIMPQTREHLAICNLLNVKKGFVALTKKDLVEKDFLELQASEARDFVKGTFLDGCPVIPVSSKNGEGLNELKLELEKIAKEVKTKSTAGLFRLPIDRVFTIKGLKYEIWEIWGHFPYF